MERNGMEWNGMECIAFVQMSFGLGVGLVTLVVLGALFAWYELCSW